MGGGEWEVTAALLDAATAATGHTFADPAILHLALSPPDPGFSRLEFLGDGVLGLAVFAAGTVAGVSPEPLKAAVSNRTLDGRLAELGLAVGPRSGDVLESLVGAVHLDAGFDAAAGVAVRIVGPVGGRVAALPAWPPPSGTTLSNPALAFIGSQVMFAAAADHLAQALPHGTARQFSTRRQELVRKSTMVLAASHGGPGFPWPADGARSTDSAADQVQRQLGQEFLDTGWDAVVPRIQRWFGWQRLKV